jgi:hypothetical protein
LLVQGEAGSGYVYEHDRIVLGEVFDARRHSSREAEVDLYALLAEDLGYQGALTGALLKDKGFRGGLDDDACIGAVILAVGVYASARLYLGFDAVEAFGAGSLLERDGVLAFVEEHHARSCLGAVDQQGQGGSGGLGAVYAELGGDGVAHPCIALHIETFDYHLVLTEGIESDDLDVDAARAQALGFAGDVSLGFPAVGRQDDAAASGIAQEAAGKAQAGSEIGAALGAEGLGATGGPLPACDVLRSEQGGLLADGDEAHGLAGTGTLQDGLSVFYLGGPGGRAETVGGVESYHEIKASVDARQHGLGKRHDEQDRAQGLEKGGEDAARAREGAEPEGGQQHQQERDGEQQEQDGVQESEIAHTLPRFQQ